MDFAPIPEIVGGLPNVSGHADVRPAMLPVCRPVHQGKVLARIKRWEPGAADRAVKEIRREDPRFNLEGGSWTNIISWVKGYENLLTPMNQLSAKFHQTLDGRRIGHPLTSQTSCFRYWGQGVWPEYGRDLCRRGTAILDHDFRAVA